MNSVYNETTVYKQGSELEIHENVLDYANDWIDISNEFSLSDGKIFKDDGTETTINELGALYSHDKGLLYFSKKSKIQYNPGLLIAWRAPLHYNGSRFYSPDNDYTNTPRLLTFGYPTDVNRGVTFFYLYRQNGGSSTDYFGGIAFIGNPGSDPKDKGLGSKIYVTGTDSPPYGFSLYQCCFKVVNK